MHDVILIDEEFEGAAATVEATCTQLEQVLSQYISIMNRAATQGTVSGASAEAMLSFVDSAREMEAMLANVREQHSGAAQRFLPEVDAADRYLF